MWYDDHAPPHIHAAYGGYEIVVGITDGISKGSFPRRALMLLSEWVRMHREELLSDWEKARNHEPLQAIPPLE